MFPFHIKLLLQTRNCIESIIGGNFAKEILKLLNYSELYLATGTNRDLS